MLMAGIALQAPAERDMPRWKPMNHKPKPEGYSTHDEERHWHDIKTGLVQPTQGSHTRIDPRDHKGIV